MQRPSIDAADVDRMADKVLLSYGKNSKRKYSAFWVLLALAGVIAGAGIVSNSTATVIGAMIVAPLMTPILGTAFAFVLADRSRMLRSALVVLGGALLVISIGFLFGLLDPLNSVVVGNPQIASRTSPNLIDLIAALATGVVGAFALARSDISDTLPGVAIAISLVPPLVVVGLTWQEGYHDSARGALLLFLTNLTAMILCATLVLLLFGVRQSAQDSGFEVGRLKGIGLVVVVGAVIAVSIPLGIGSAQVYLNSYVKYTAASTVRTWAATSGWSVLEYNVTKNVMTVVAIGPPPSPDLDSLRTQLDAAGFADIDVQVDLVAGGRKYLPGNESSGPPDQQLQPNFSPI